MKVLGLMSGTSLDGIDAALLDVEGGNEREGGDPPRNLKWSLLAFHTRAYAPEERRLIQETLASGGAKEVCLLHTRMGEWFASATLELLDNVGLSPGSVAAIGSHGQTLWHEPPGSGGRGSSLQVGCPATLAERTGIGVVSDFRARDLAAGGQGAPLVPWADRVFFSSPEGPRAIQNLGGMGNVTWLPSASDPRPLMAFDTGPGVALLDAAVELGTEGEETFDRDGRWAARGTVAESEVERLMDHPFFRIVPPRSTGREVFGPAMAAEVAAALGAGVEPGGKAGAFPEVWPDVLATLTAFTARTIGDAYRRWVLPLGIREVLLTGGGSRNPSLVRAIEAELAPLPVRTGEALGMDPDAREAAAFALLAWAHLNGVPGNVPEATGAAGPRVLGSWTPPGAGRES